MKKDLIIKSIIFFIFQAYVFIRYVKILFLMS